MADASAPSAAPTPSAVSTPAAEPTADIKAGAAEQKAEAAVARLLKLQIDGKELELPEDEVIRRAQKGSAADKRFREANELKKSAETQKAQINNMISTLKNDPDAFMKWAEKDLGISRAEFADKILTPLLQQQIDEAEELKMSPEQKQIKKYEREMASMRKAEAERLAKEQKDNEQRSQAQRKAEVDRLTNQMGQTVLDALKSTTLPQTPATASRLVSLMEQCVEQGIPFDAKSLARELEAETREQLKALTKSGHDWLPDDIKRDIAKGLASADPEIQKLAQKAAVQALNKNNGLTGSKPVSGKKAEREAEERRPGRVAMNFMKRNLAKGTIT